MKQITQKCHLHEIGPKHQPRMLRSIVSWRELALTLKPVEGKSMNTRLQQHHHLPISEMATRSPRNRGLNAARAERRDGGYPSSRGGALKTRPSNPELAHPITMR